MIQINIVNGSVEYDGIPVLSEINFEIKEKEKIALVGRNGCGKTTLLKALCGEVELVRGTGDEDLGFYTAGKPVIGYLKQVAFRDERITLLAEVQSAFSELLEIEAKMEAALVKLEADSSPENVKSYSYLCDRFGTLGGYTYKKECLTAIRKFGFSDAEMIKPLSEFSGGQLTKIALLKLLLSAPDVLLLDEPTNHLDVEAIEWLEEYLSAYKKACVIVSHDRMFLDKTVNVVYEIEYGEMKRYKGNYSAFFAQKCENFEKAVKDATEKKKEIERLQKVVERFRYKANKAVMAQAKLAQIKRIGTVDLPSRFDDSTFRSNFQPAEESSREVLTTDKLGFGYDKPLGVLSLRLEKGDKLGIIGSNGTGKSTLVHTLMSFIPKLSGSFSFGYQVKIGYFDQTMTQSAVTATVLEDFRNEFPNLNDTEARTALGSFQLSGEDVFKRVADLSGGEKVRFALCKILKRRPNLLILDEPTNHMDIIGKETFENLLRNYSGTIIIVSHDRYLIKKVCDRLLIFSHGGARIFDGNYDEYERSLAEEKKLETTTGGTDVGGKQRFRKTSETKEQQRKRHRIEVLEGKISVIEKELADLNSLLDNPIYNSDYKKVIELQAGVAECEKRLAPFIEEWEALSVDI